MNPNTREGLPVQAIIFMIRNYHFQSNKKLTTGKYKKSPNDTCIFDGGLKRSSVHSSNINENEMIRTRFEAASGQKVNGCG